MDKKDNFEYLSSLISKVQDRMKEKPDASFDEVTTDLLNTDCISFKDFILINKSVEYVNNIVKGQSKEKAKSRKENYLMRRLYMTMPMTILMVFLLLLTLPSFFNPNKVHEMFIIAFAPIIIPFILRTLDSKFIGEEVCRLNKDGIIFNPKYVEADSSIPKEKLDFFSWDEIDEWQFKFMKSPLQLYPVLYIKTRTYRDKIITVNHFNYYGLKTLKMYNENRGKVV